jgi:hypothetical protein
LFISLFIALCLKLDPGTHKGIHSVLALKLGVTLPLSHGRSFFTSAICWWRFGKESCLLRHIFSTMHGYVDEMVAAGKPLDDDDIVSYILNGLDAEYNSLMEHVNGMADLISPKMLYSRLLDTEARLASQKAQRGQKEHY